MKPRALHRFVSGGSVSSHEINEESKEFSPAPLCHMLLIHQQNRYSPTENMLKIEITKKAITITRFDSSFLSKLSIIKLSACEFACIPSSVTKG
ncbi:hypothetical protein, partial [Moorena sp. SIO1F2]|uniref:hypothetical protein n=1 Tax=Moorena sp. SIO1F2 TaxID=2607819 RepID=UPI0026014C31